MLKRKRHEAGLEGHSRGSHVHKHDVEEKLDYCRKLLHRALKTAKGFERQKLAKKEKQVKDAGGDLAQVKKEIEILKSLDFTKAVEIHLYKSLLKSKSIAESEYLPEYVKGSTQRWSGDDEDLKIINNVMARMCNTKPAKESMNQIMDVMYSVLKLGRPGEKLQQRRGETKIRENGDTATAGGDITSVQPASELPWEGFDTEDDAPEESHQPGDDDSTDGSPDDSEDDYSRYDALIANSDSDDDDSDSGMDGTVLTHAGAAAEADGGSRDLSVSLSPSPPPRARLNTDPTTKNTSTFLPSLMGGYWSGSEQGSDDEEAAADLQPRKNRMGQMARRALWEKKYGSNAKHLAKSKNTRDDGWDARRGAKGPDDSRRDSRGQRPWHGRGGRWGADRSSHDVDASKPSRPAPKRDDQGVLHPSWQAAKKAKDTEKTAKFQGKKVVFD